jgi:hypothetical protein
MTLSDALHPQSALPLKNRPLDISYIPEYGQITDAEFVLLLKRARQQNVWMRQWSEDNSRPLSKTTTVNMALVDEAYERLSRCIGEPPASSPTTPPETITAPSEDTFRRPALDEYA